MARTYTASGLVLKRTKLGETDLIVTLLTDGTCQVRAVAKGARKPGTRLAGTMNLGNEVDLLLHEGRNLDVVSEAKLVRSHATLAQEYERSAMAEAVLDCAASLTAEGEHDARLLPLTRAALDALEGVPKGRIAMVGAAYVLKAASIQGYRPVLNTCVRCGADVDLRASELLMFDVRDGGCTCGACSGTSGGFPVSAALLGWANALLGMRFADIVDLREIPGESRLGLDLLELARQWVQVYPGIRPPALEFVLSSGIY